MLLLQSVLKVSEGNVVLQWRGVKIRGGEIVVQAAQNAAIASQNLTVQSNDLFVTAGNNAVLTVGRALSAQVGHAFSIESGNDFTLLAGGAASLNIGKIFAVQGGHGLSLTSGGSVAIRGIDIMVESRDQVTLKGKGLEQSAQTVSLEAGGSTSLVSRGSLDLKGTVLHANGKIM